MKRKIIQLVGPSEEYAWKFVALCDDGTWWYLETNGSKDHKTTDWWQGKPMCQDDDTGQDEEET